MGNRLDKYLILERLEKYGWHQRFIILKKSSAYFDVI
jgi:hypothetical protein